MPPHIRSFKPADLTRIQDIAASAWQPVFRSLEELLGADLFNLVSPDPETAKRGQVATACELDSGTHVWVVEDGDEIMGFITADMNRETLVGEIRNNAIDPNRQSGGLGVRMYDFVLERMKEAGMKAVKVNTGADEAHAPARRAYEKAGFERSIPSVMYYRAI
jgi:GNAT superfamily N-acetyltransferase